MGGGEIRSRPDGAPVRVLGLGAPARRLHQNTQVEMSIRVFRVQIEGLAIGRFRRVEPAQRLEGVAQVIVCLDEIRALGKRRLELLDPFPDVARLASDHGAQVQGARMLGLVGQSLAA